MFDLTRRQLLESGLAAAAVRFSPRLSGDQPKSASLKGGSSAFACTVAETPRERLLMDRNWKFALGHANDPGRDFGFGKLARERTFAKADHIWQATAKFDDGAWRTLDLPHDWAIELPFVSTEFAPEQGAKPLGREFPNTSVGWYRKTFDLPSGDQGRRFQIEFDGVFRDSMVLLNGHYLTTSFSGYAPFILDISDWVNVGGTNVLAVRVDATLGAGWFYEGAGIYRHVWLIKTAPLHLVEWGTYVRSEVRGGAAQIELGSEVRNASDAPKEVRVTWQLLGPAGATVATAQSEQIVVDPWAQHTFQAQTSIRDPQLWSIEHPHLYQAIVTIHSSGATLDADQTTFGIRTLHFDADEGFFLNGRHVKIKGTCCHQDHAGVGAALPDRLQYYRVERLKSMGSNALRTSHNPPTPALVDATDRLGMLVLCETRMMDSSPEGLSQLERMVRRFRNHPSIFMWSLGNEEPEEGTDRGIRILTTMKRLAHQLDPTRLCTFAQNEDFGIGISHVVDVQGFNYGENFVDKFHRDFPHQPCMGTEGNGTACTRGIYEDDKTTGYVSAYDVTAPPWASTAQKWWSFYDERPFLAGSFSWTGFDYRGEPWPYVWPCVSSQFGIMDTCGFPKDNYYYFKAWWGYEPVLHLFPQWNWPESKRGQKISVWCHTNLESVELFLNGASQGTHKVVRNCHVEWKVKYQPGVIEARGTKDGKVVLTAKRETTGEPARISLHPDRTQISADGEDVSVITVEVQDPQGRCVPVAQNDVAFQVSGGGKLLGLGNGNPSSHEADQADHRRVFRGWAQAIVQSSREPGTIIVQATSPGLEGSTVTIASIASTPRPSV